MQFDSGTDPAAAAALAKNADVAIVFAHQWESEGMDLDSLSLPDNQDELIAKVAAANPHTVVVLETGTAVTMPWADQVSGILEAWFAGSRGAEAVANILFGDVNPSAKLPITFPKSEADLPHAMVVKPPKVTVDADRQGWKRIAAGLPAFQVTYDEGVKVGYKWYDAENKPVLFPFGIAMPLTEFFNEQLAGLKCVSGGAGSSRPHRSRRSGIAQRSAQNADRSGSGAGFPAFADRPR